MQKVKTWWNDTGLTVKLLSLLLGLMISVGGWAVAQMVEAPRVYAKQADFANIGKVVLEIPANYARKDELKANKIKLECNIKELSQEMGQRFDRMGDKIDINNSAVNAKIDALMMLLMQQKDK